MKALTFKRYGKSPEIEFADVPRPPLKADELLVQVHAEEFGGHHTQFKRRPLGRLALFILPKVQLH
jgi:hypothetical protein